MTTINIRGYANEIGGDRSIPIHIEANSLKNFISDNEVVFESTSRITTEVGYFVLNPGVWQIMLQGVGVEGHSEGYYIVPEESPVNWDELIQVDPATLEPVPDVLPSPVEILEGAQEARDAADNWASEANMSAGKAEEEAKLAIDAANRSQMFRDNARTAMADARTQAGYAQASAQGAEFSADEARVHAQAARDAVNSPGRQGEKGDTGDKGNDGVGAPFQVALGNVSLDTITAGGFYRQPTVGNATPANSYPVAAAGILEVFQSSGASNVLQRYTPHSGVGVIRGIYIRRSSNGVWASWQFLARQQVIDDAAGRRIITWDDVNNRDQLLYGDTGFRNIGITENPPYTGGLIILRRVGSIVQLAITDLILKSGITGNIEMSLIPSGFRANVQGEGLNAYSAERNRLIAIAGVSTFRISAVTAATARVSATMQWMTSDPWPSVLPGTANGTIPFA